MKATKPPAPTSALVFRETESVGRNYLTVEKGGKLTREEVLTFIKECERRCHYIDLSGRDLSGLDLSWANLSKATLGGANLRGANLNHADLGDANLSRADLTEANLEYSNLGKAEFWAAKLVRANLKNIILKKTHFADADLREARFEDTVGIDAALLYNGAGAIVTSKQVELIMKAVEKRLRAILRVEDPQK